MTGMVANVLLNILLVGLLTATIMYCYVLNRRIRVLQDSKSELAELLKSFDESTLRASETIVAMQTASKRIGDNIQLKLDKAKYLLDDLSFSIDKGTRLTSQIEASFAVNRARTKTLSEQNIETPAIALEPVDAIDHNKPTAPKPAAKRNPASIEAILEKVVSRKQQMQNETQAREAQVVPRSRAEQELIELIRSSKV